MALNDLGKGSLIILNCAFTATPQEHYMASLMPLQRAITPWKVCPISQAALLSFDFLTEIWNSYTFMLIILLGNYPHVPECNSGA